MKNAAPAIVNARAASLIDSLLPREVGERLVGVGHAVDVFAAGHGRAFAVVGGDQLVGQLLRASAGPSFRGTASRIQRIASDCCRVRFTCIGTW